MALFDFFKRKSSEKNDQVDIPKDKFVDDSDPNDSGALAVMGIDAVFEFLQDDYETRGYGDALVNPDNSYMEMNLDLLRKDCTIVITKARNYYKDINKDIEFHIESRSRNGLIDIVEELKMKKEKVEDHLLQLDILEKGSEDESNIFERVELSYKRGFLRGLASITNSDVLNRKL